MHLGGVVCIVIACCSLGWAGWVVADRLAPRRELKPLVAIIMAISAAMVVLEALGAIGWLSKAPVLVGSIGVGLAATVWSRGREGSSDHSEAPESEPVWVRAISLATVGGALGLWLMQTAGDVRNGITEVDSIQYHLTHSAAFVESHSIWGFHPVTADPFHAFHPMGDSLLSAGSMALAGTDVFVPLEHLLWFALALCAAWAIGRPHGRGHTALAVTAAVLVMPVLSAFAGTALADPACVALVAASAALLLELRHHPQLTVAAGLSVGLALGTKLSVLPTLALLVLGAVAFERIPIRRVLSVLGVAVAVGGVWYIRNLRLAHSPVPATNLPFFHRTPTPMYDRLDGTLVSAARRDIGVSGILDGLSRGYTIAGLVSVGALLVVAAIALAKRGACRTLAAGGLGGFVAYTFTPLSGTVNPALPTQEWVMVNARYAVPAIWLLGMTGVALDARTAWPRALLLGGSGVVLLASVWNADRGPSDTLARVFGDGLGVGPVAWAALGALIGAAYAFAGPLVARRAPHLSPAPVVAGALIVGILVGLVMAHGYDDRRYGGSTSLVHNQAGPVLHWVYDHAPMRVAVLDVLDLYPYAGDHAQNEVVYLGVRGPLGAFRAATTCTDLRTAVNRLQPDAIVVDDIGRSTNDPAGWLDTAPGIRRVAVEGNRHLYEVDGRTSARGCNS